MRRWNIIFILLCLLLLTPLVHARTPESISIGRYVNYAIAQDGALLAWGMDDFGLLGTEPVSAHAPVTLMQNARAVQGASHCVFVIDQDNTLWGMGTDWFGLRALSEPLPVTVPSIILEDVTQIAVGERHALALKTDGSLWGWGDTTLGQLDPNPTARPARDVPSLSLPHKLMENIGQVACSSYGACALSKTGVLHTWGDIAMGEEQGVMGEIVSLEGDGFLCKDASLWAWRETTTGAYALEKVMDDVQQSCAGDGFYAVLKTDGTLWTWGQNNRTGQLGNGTTDPQEMPQCILEHVAGIAFSDEHGLILCTDGSLWQIGYPHTTALTQPTQEASRFYTPYLLMEGIQLETAPPKRDAVLSEQRGLLALLTLSLSIFGLVVYRLS